MTDLTKTDREAFGRVINKLFPEGPTTRIGTGRKVDGHNERVDVQCGNLSDWHPDVLHWVVSQGLSRIHGAKLNDVPTEGGVKLEAFRALIKTLNTGTLPDEFTDRRGSGGTARQDPVEYLALKKAKDTLKLAFSKRTGSGKVRDWASSDDAKVAAYFTKDGVWNDAKVKEWAAGKPSGRDFWAEASAELDTDVDI